MPSLKINIVEYDDTRHRHEVIELWQSVFGYEAVHNSPPTVIDKKIEFNDGLFFVSEKQQTVVGTVMAGYDGHRGWIYSIAVRPDLQNQGIGSALLAFAQDRLITLGCRKINLQIMEGNETVQRFYRANGFLVEKRVSMGKIMH